MVFIACVLFTVSTLAVHGKIASTDGPVPRGCEGKTFCNVKPADYPQTEIDHYLENNPAYLQRMKRETNLWSDACQAMKEQRAKLEDGSQDGNCRTEMECTYPYVQHISDSRMPRVVVQSKFFKQAIPQVRCIAKEEPCLVRFTREYNTKCEEITVNTNVYVWDKLKRNVTFVPATLYVDCVCMFM